MMRPPLGIQPQYVQVVPQGNLVPFAEEHGGKEILLDQGAGFLQGFADRLLPLARRLLGSQLVEEAGYQGLEILPLGRLEHVGVRSHLYGLAGILEMRIGRVYDAAGVQAPGAE